MALLTGAGAGQQLVFNDLRLQRWRVDDDLVDMLALAQGVPERALLPCSSALSQRALGLGLWLAIAVAGGRFAGVGAVQS